MKAEILIEEAIREAKIKGVKIIKGPILDWVDPITMRNCSGLPHACNAVGAVVIKIDKLDMVFPDFVRGWYKEVLEYIGEDAYWLWRFCKGFDQGNMQVASINGYVDKKDTATIDKVSKIGDKLAKQFVD